MSITDLAVFKAHLRVDGNEEDALAQTYLDAAERAVADRIGAELGEGAGEQPMTSAITAAVLLWGGHFYENREAVVTGTISTTIPLAVDSLLEPYRRWLPEVAE